MILFKKCPCCGSRISFWSYFYQDNFRDQKDKNNGHIKCKSCNKIILLRQRKRPILHAGVLILLAISMYLLFVHSFSWSWLIVLLILMMIISYIDYRNAYLKCYDGSIMDHNEEELFPYIISAIITLVLAFLVFGIIFSFALDMKAKNHQKSKVEHVIKDKI